MNFIMCVRKLFHSPIVLILAIAFSFIPSMAIAQSGAGSIQGTVKDETGAVIVSAQVHVVNTATNVATNAKSNHAGFYQVPELFVGHYRMTVTAPGMKTYETSVELLVAQNVVINPVMPAGAISQTVEVDANMVQLTTNDSAAIESTLENERISQLPENGRELNTLVSLSTPGIENGSAGLTVNGGDPEALEYIIDGARSKSNQNGSTPQSKTLVLDPDAVQEVRVVTSNSSAQYSTPSSAVTTTKSGTNHLHGTFFETARNNAFGVDRNRQDPVGQKAPKLIRNEFGLSAGGPVYIPKVYDGRNKTFWFFAYERYSLSQTKSSLIAVPTAAMRQGDFSGLVTAAGQPQIIFDPATTVAAMGPCDYLTQLNKGTTVNSTFCRTPFPGNTIGKDRMSPLAAVYYQLMPLPTTDDNPLVKGNYLGKVPTFEAVPQQTFRIDQTFNENNRAYLRYTHQHAAVNVSDSGPLNNAIPGIPAGAAMGYSNNPSENFTAAVGFTHIFSPSLFSETIISQSWFNNAIITGASPNTDYESLLNLPNNFGEVGFPSVTALIQNLTSSQKGNAAQAQINSLLDENLTKTIGRHQILFGGRIQHVRENTQPVGLADSVVTGKNSVALYDPTSKKNYNPVTNTGYADAAFFLGAAGAYTVNLEAPHIRYHEWREAMYVQDNFHMRSNFTINLGLRYEAYPALYTNDGLMNSFDLKNDAVVLAGKIPDLIAKKYTTQAIITNDQLIGMKFETPQEAGMPAGTLLKNYNLNFLPRLGMAWTVSRSRWSPIIRGGYGIYLYDTPLENFANHPENNNPFTATYTRSYASAAQAVDALPNELLRYNDPVMFGVAGLNTANVVDTTSTTSILPGVTLWSDTPDWKPVRVQQANVTVELPLPGRSALRLSWIGSKTTNVDVSLSYNQTPTVYQWEAQTGTLPPTGGVAAIGTNTYAAVATNPYDNITYGGSGYHTKDGWANYNSLQVNYQRLFHAGFAYQVSYVYGKAMRAGGDSGGGNGDSTVLADAGYPGVMGSKSIVSLLPGGVTPFAGVAPPPRPANLPDWQAWHEMIKYQLYELDTSIPVHHIKFNGIYDIPVGRGKKYLSNSSRWLNEIIGGFQLAGNGSVVSQEFQPGSGNWGPTNPLHVYKKRHPVRDCSSGVCYNNFLWWNGDISPQVNPNDPNHDASLSSACEAKSTCISNIPASYVPFQTSSHNTPSDPNFNTDLVQLTLLDGSTTTGTYDAGPIASNYTSKKFLAGPFNWVADLSVFKVFPIREGMNIRVNLDAFNVFNVAGENAPGANGIQGFIHNYSLDTARELQITARFTF